MDISITVTKVRFWYHANLLSINNALNQMHILSNKKAEQNNKKHAMIIFNDIFPRLGITDEEIATYFVKEEDA